MSDLTRPATDSAVRRFRLCPVCHGVHRGIPECVGRPQTDREWMLDRGVRPDRADEIIEARAAVEATGHALPPMAQPAPDQRSLF